MKENIRDLENMPLNIKFTYSKILGLMTCIEGEDNQLKVGELYRIIKKIELPSSQRIQLMNFIMKKELDFSEICKNIDLDKYLNQQERNIFRFSLMKDLIIIAKADHVETEKEKSLLKEVQTYFNISDEQLSFFEEEYELDRCYFDGNINNKQFKSMAKSTISAAIALGIPLTTIYYSGTLKGLGPLGTISGLKSLGMKRKTKKNSIAIGIGTSIALGIITYNMVNYLLNIKKDEKTKLSNLMKENIETLHQETKNILYEDIGYFTNRILEIDDRTGKKGREIESIIDILKRAVLTLENTQAVVI